MKYLISYFLFSVVFTANAQKPDKLNSNQIFEKIQELNFLGTALYIAAHPDDENTRLISYLSNQVKAKTVYLSLTRGDGGQNLIGPEIRESLGLIRTQELLAARGIDGGEQRFSRANDFGFSKDPEETLEIWNRKEVLSDVVWAIRTLKPDVIINRFDHRTPGTTHGHHTSSAMLSVAAFDLASDKNQFKNQLNYTDVWQPQRLFFNTSWWFYGSEKKFEEERDDTKFSTLDVGVYYPQKGLSNNEIAALASSQHLCQGFGRLSTRGSEKEYLEFLKGDKPINSSDIFSGINTTWSRVKGGDKIAAILSKVEEGFNFKNPSKHLSELMKAYVLINDLEDEHWKAIKKKEIETIILACSGLYIEVTANTGAVTPNSNVNLEIETLNRSSEKVMLKSIVLLPENKIISKNIELKTNVNQPFKEVLALDNEAMTNPYWLNEIGTVGMYTVKEQQKIGQPNTPRNISVDFNLEIDNTPITITKEVVHRFSKRDKGELYESLEVVPELTTKIKEKVLIFSDSKAKKVIVEVKSGIKNATGELTLEHPKGWTVSPEKISFSIVEKGDAKDFVFYVSPPSQQSEGEILAVASMQGKKYNKEQIEIVYDHIPKQTLLQKAATKIVRLNIEKKGTFIGYIQGAGDVVPESLTQIGYEVSTIHPENINTENLEKYDAIVVGIRAYNTVDALKFKQKFLLGYVKNGGNLIVQYNTKGRSELDVLAPFPLEVSNKRVTNENATVTFLDNKHDIVNIPNKITSADFEGWVQERGLYFPNKWSSEYEAIFGMHDKGEPLLKGSLLVASYGKGNYIYTGLSFFRELPAGVPGAYKLFANMLSYKK
ncbi:PIG-L family deacetylase [Wenyingzhuangia sp. 1_MG-2023]|nr:PIG-L family deacetylase [Wenyingzhuangia sp. 1_MG-2023]